MKSQKDAKVSVLGIGAMAVSIALALPVMGQPSKPAPPFDLVINGGHVMPSIDLKVLTQYDRTVG